MRSKVVKSFGQPRAVPLPATLIYRHEIASGAKRGTPRVLAFTASKGRPHQLVNCALQMQAQSYPVDHSIFINHPDAIASQDTTNYANLILKYIQNPKGKVTIGYGKSGSQHQNHTSAINLSRVQDYDIFLKIDDDDFYFPDYVKSVVDSWFAQRWDFSGSHSDGMMKGEEWQRVRLLHSLGEGRGDEGVIKVMPPTMAFSRAAIQKILSIPEPETKWEDKAWRQLMAKERQLKSEVRKAAPFMYNLHGGNISRQAPGPGEKKVLQTIVPDFPTNYNSGFRWEAVMVTAPRENPTIEASLRSCELAGFTPTVFAEPGSFIPEWFPKERVVFNEAKMGVLINSFNAIRHALAVNPRASVIVYLQDDIEIMPGLRTWLERELWPDHCPVVSLYTATHYQTEETGWKIHKHGYYRTYGALGLVFRRDAAEDYVSHPKVINTIHSGQRTGDDAITGQWALERGHGIAYHSPSLVTHTGETSTLRNWRLGPVAWAEAPKTEELIKDHKRPVSSMALIGWNTAQGIGTLTRGAAKHLNPEKWIIPTHPRFPELGDTNGMSRVQKINLDIKEAEMAQMVDGHTWLFFVETPFIGALPGIARGRGVQVACMPMWEWLTEDLSWLKYVDIFLCPTKHTYDMLSTWRKRMGATWDLEYVPCPIDDSDIKFKQRERADVFLFNNGTGGGKARLTTGGWSEPRKGCDVIAHAAKLAKDVNFVVRTQVEIPGMPPNVQVIGPAEDYAELYEIGDVSVQPSRYEGVGLQALECQAAGLPLITTNATPMNEFNPIEVVNASLFRGSCFGKTIINGWEPDPRNLASIIRKVNQSDIREKSKAARAYIESTHSWNVIGPKIRDILGLKQG